MSEFNNTSSMNNNIFLKGMYKDITDILIEKGLYNNAINAINIAHTGELGTISNEPSNLLMTGSPYTIIGFAYLHTSKWVLFSTNDSSSEIGIYDDSIIQYHTVVNDVLLNFKKHHLITAVTKENHDGTWSVYFQDNNNPDRVLNLDKIPYKILGYTNNGGCLTPNYSTDLDVDAIRLHPLVKQPTIKIKKGLGAGQITNGSYIATIAYSENGVRLSPYSVMSQPQGLWEHVGLGGSLDIILEDIDDNYNEYELVIVGVVSQNTIAKRIGYYSTSQKIVHLDLITQDLPTVNLAELPLLPTVYDKSEKMFDLNGYLIRTSVTSYDQVNYQPLANNIKARWYAVKYPKDYYWKGGNNVGYMRDEVYPFFIRFVYNTGARTASYHIPGRAKKASDSVLVNDTNTLTGETEVWQVYDTSTKYTAGSVVQQDGGILILKGDMGYHESTEIYDDKTPQIWGDLCGKPIRHHKMPSNETTHIHTDDGYISVLGVEFYNIAKPRDLQGNIIENIVGYEILRGSREGNRSIVAKGMFSNMMEFRIKGKDPGEYPKGLFQNYPYNDLRPDSFLTNDYTVAAHGRGRREAIEKAEKLSTYRQDIFSFHSPETNFVKPYLGGNHVKIYTEEYGNSKGNFEIPYKHPKFKMITDFTFVTAGVVGLGIALSSAIGKIISSKSVGITVPVAATLTSSVELSSKAIGTVIPGVGTAMLGAPLATAGAIISLLAQFSFFWGEGTEQALDIIRKIGKFRDYYLQFNSHGYFDKSKNVVKTTASLSNYPSLRRECIEANYISSGIQDLDDKYRINNLNRNKFVAIKLKSAIPNPSVIDKSKFRLQDANSNDIYENYDVDIVTPISSYYGAIKVDYQNQYGQIDSIVQLPVESRVHDINSSSSGVLFGGDIYINRYTEKNPYMFFNSWLHDVPDGTEFKYTNYINGPVPRYWADFNYYDVSDFEIKFTSSSIIDSDEVNNKFKNYINTPSDLHRFDKPTKISGMFIIKNQWAYLFYNGVRDFYVESELNIAYRDFGEQDYEKFYDVYGNSFSDLSMMFRTDKIINDIYYKYDLSLSSSKLFNNFASLGKTLPRDYDPHDIFSHREYLPKRAVYSLKQQSGLKRDNWKNFLPLNYKDFNDKINNIKKMNSTGAVILFENSEPVEFVGVDQLQTTAGVKVTVGDGGLFQQSFKSLANADDVMKYGSSISYRGAVNTPFGLFYVSQQSGKVFRVSQNLEEISAQGLNSWFANNLPSHLLKVYPGYPLYDNPVKGIGVSIVYDPTFKLIYITKKDYKPLYNDYSYDSNGNFYRETEVTEESRRKTHCPFSNPKYWEDASWTISYDPKSNNWISFHDWHPNFMVQSYDHFFTIPDNMLWKHNARYDSFTNYYNKDYGWEIDFSVPTPNTINTIRNIEYVLDCYKYSNNVDFKHLLDENFDRAVVYNSEQISGILKLNIRPKNSPLSSVTYPSININSINILCSKEENKYRFNQFWDITKDRGEFTNNITNMWVTKADGYRKVINSSYINYAKSKLQRKKFRHYNNNVILRKTTSGDVKMLLKLVNSKLLNSPR